MNRKKFQLSALCCFIFFLFFTSCIMQTVSFSQSDQTSLDENDVVHKHEVKNYNARKLLTERIFDTDVKVENKPKKEELVYNLAISNMNNIENITKYSSRVTEADIASNGATLIKSTNLNMNNDESLQLKIGEFNTRVSEKTLDTFLSGKLSTTEAGNILPIFLIEPESGFAVKSRPVELKCKVAYALQVNFKCSGSSQPPPSTHDKHVDPHSGVHLEEVTAVIHRDLVDEYFGKGPFKCECLAWSSRGVVKSRSATINIAFIRKQFKIAPSSLKEEIGTRVDLSCDPPVGFPEPKISWYKNNVPILETTDNGLLSSAGRTLTFSSIGLQDMANYTCSAENIAGKRTTELAVLIIFVNGGWSAWSTWKECKCSGKTNQGRKRIRFCNNPLPINGGAQCSGPHIQKTTDCVSCEAGKWSAWSEWSPCSSDCIQVRQRKCLSTLTEEVAINELTNVLGIETNYEIVENEDNNIQIDKMRCFGKDIQTAECRGKHCQIGNNYFDWTLYLGLAFISLVCFTFGTALICCARRSIFTNSDYSIAQTEFAQGVEKKSIRTQINAVNISYEYTNPDGFTENNEISGWSSSEHHYDVPNLTTNYINPIDEFCVDYITKTDEGADIGNSLNESKISAFQSINSTGGSLSLFNGEILLYIPELAICKNQKKEISLNLLCDESNYISMSCTEWFFICSTFVYCSPRIDNFLKPVILKIPHCLTDPKVWKINIYYADNDIEDVNINWHKIITVGEETINTPVFVHITKTHVYIMTEQLGRFVVVANPKDNIIFNNSSIRMKLIGFSQLPPSSTTYSLRIYVVKDFPNNKDICTGIECKLGGTYMGESEAFAFFLNKCNLNIYARNAETDVSKIYKHVIPYSHILSNNSMLHCEFNIKGCEDKFKNMKLAIDFMQCETPLENDFHSFFIPNHLPSTSDTHTTVSINKHGNYVNDTKVINRVQLPRITKRLICTALDPPRSDERDWRLLAKELNTDRYIAYFATKASPTEQILNLWECRASTSQSTLAQLIAILKSMDRQDVTQIILETIGSLWI